MLELRDDSFENPLEDFAHWLTRLVNVSICERVGLFVEFLDLFIVPSDLMQQFDGFISACFLANFS